MRRHALVVVVGLVVGCGGASRDPATPKDVEVKAVAGGPGVAGGSAASGRRSPSRELQAAFTVESPEVLVFADLGGLFKTKLVGGLADAILALAGKEIKPADRKCVEIALDGFRDMALGRGKNKEEMVVLRFDPAAQKGVESCASRVASEHETKVDGATKAWESGSDVWAIVPGMVIGGPRPLVAKAIAGKGDGAALAGVGLGPDEYVSFFANLPEEGIRSKGTLLASDQRFRVAVTADLPDEEIAKVIEQGLGGQGIAKRLPTGGKEAELAANFLKSITITRSGKRIDFALDLQERVEDQIRDISMMATLGVYGVRKYIANAKQAEAKNTVATIAKDVVMSFETENGKPFAKKKLPSFPAVPATVPKGVKYQSSEADWKAWAPLKFSMSSPQYYQYEVKASKDGESAEVIARGDLNGDGKTSQFKVVLRIKRPQNQVFVEPNIVEIDPEE